MRVGERVCPVYFENHSDRQWKFLRFSKIKQKQAISELTAFLCFCNRSVKIMNHVTETQYKIRDQNILESRNFWKPYTDREKDVQYYPK